MKRILAVVLTLVALVAMVFMFTGCLGKDYTPKQGAGTVVTEPPPPPPDTGGTAGDGAAGGTAGGGAAKDTGGDDDEDVFGGD